MFATDLYLDQVPTDWRLATAFGAAFGTSPKSISIVSGDATEELAAVWKEPGTAIVIQTSRQDGEFPLVLEIFLRDSMPKDFIDRLETAAQILGSSILTYQCLPNPLSDAEYWLVGADGRSELVFADTDDWDSNNPTFKLLPDSQRIHQSHVSNQLQRAD